MSTTVDLKEHTQVPLDAGPFRLGWRDISRRRPDGTFEVERIPLTLEDLLHPLEGDVILQNSVHDTDWRYLADVFQSQVAGDPSALVLVDCCVTWDDPRLRYHSPDLAVIFGVRQQRPVWSNFDVAEQGVRPRVLLEVVSPLSRENDVVTKFRLYHLARVPKYVLVDREQEEGPPRILGYQYTPTRYLPMPTDERGWLWLEELGVWLAAKDNRVVCYSRDGVELGDYTRVREALASEQQARQEAEEHLKAESARAEAESARAEAESARAEAESARAEVESARAEVERTRAESAEARARELEAELQRLRGEPPT